MQPNITVSFNPEDLDPIISELKSRPAVARTVVQMIDQGRQSELFDFELHVQDGHLVGSFTSTPLLRLMLSSADC